MRWGIILNYSSEYKMLPQVAMKAETTGHSEEKRPYDPKALSEVIQPKLGWAAAPRKARCKEKISSQHFQRGPGPVNAFTSEYRRDFWLREPEAVKFVVICLGNHRTLRVAVFLMPKSELRKKRPTGQG